MLSSSSKMYKEMIKSAHEVLVKMIKIEILYWEMVKTDEFNFLKFKILLNPLQKYYFLVP